MTKKIEISPIGIIRTPYANHSDVSIQGRFKPDVEGWIELKQEYAMGLVDLDGFSHAILIYYFHKTDKEVLSGRPFLEDHPHGVFAIRSPHRPNRIGISVIRIKSIEVNIIRFTNVDMLDGTPLLDIKPYVSHFDSFPDARCGWVDKHFAGATVPERAVKKQGEGF